MKVLAYGKSGNTVIFKCRYCESIVEMYETEADWYNVPGEVFGVVCPVCSCYGEYTADGEEAFGLNGE